MTQSPNARRRADRAVRPDTRGGGDSAVYCTTDQTNVAEPDTPFVSVAVTVTV